MNAKKKDEWMSLEQAQILRPPFPSHVEPVEREDGDRISAQPVWQRAMVKAGIMANSSNEFPRINPTVIALLALLLPAVIALIAGGVYMGRQSATMESLQDKVSHLEQSRVDDNKYIESMRADFEARISELSNPKKGK